MIIFDAICHFQVNGFNHDMIAPWATQASRLHSAVIKICEDLHTDTVRMAE